jgi:hypothetical protein
MNRKITIATVLALGMSLLFAGNALGLVAEEWDKSSLKFTASCDGDCDEITATVCNGRGSENMAGTTTWELYWIASGNPKRGIVIASDTINALAAGTCQTLTYDPSNNSNGASGSYMFRVDQRPGHPGKGVLWSNACGLVCEAPMPTYTPTNTPTPILPTPTNTATTTPFPPGPTNTATTTPFPPGPTNTATTTPFPPGPTNTATTTPFPPGPTNTATTTPFPPGPTNTATTTPFPPGPTNTATTTPFP